MSKPHECWNHLVEGLGLDLSHAVNYVGAEDIDRLCNHQEPRIVASMDKESKLPESFREKGVFVLPVTNDRYAIVHGRGYHELDPIDGEPERFHARLPFRLTTSTYGKGENRYILQAQRSGLLSHFTKTSEMFETLGGKSRVGEFKFRVGHTELQADGAQMEIDKAYEGRHDVLLFEAKADHRDNFLIRQLYYPYRVVSGITPKKVRCFFFLASPKEETYRIWEYRWKEGEEDDYEAIDLVNSGSFIIEEEEPPIETFESIEPDRLLDIVPQADDIQKIADFPLLVADGIDTSQKWADNYGITSRQGSYYREASEAFGLVSMQDSQYVLTSEGRKYVGMEPVARADFLAERILRIPLMNRVFKMLRENRTRGVGVEEIARLIEQTSHLGGTTPRRRASSVRAYFKWLAQTTGAVVFMDRRIYPRDAGLERFGR